MGGWVGEGANVWPRWVMRVSVRVSGGEGDERRGGEGEGEGEGWGWG